jgi:hypothetical protein
MPSPTGERNLSKLQSAARALRRVESWAGAKDGSNAMGPFRRFIWQPSRRHADAYRADKAKYLKRYRDLLDGVAPTLTQAHRRARAGLHLRVLPGRHAARRRSCTRCCTPATRQQQAQAAAGPALGQGKRGRHDLDTSRWDAFVNRMIKEGVLTRADFDFAQGVWDLLEEHEAAGAKAHRDVFGRYFDEVTAAFKDAAHRFHHGRRFTTNAGSEEVEYRGGYVPAMPTAGVVKDAGHPGAAGGREAPA